MDVSTEPGLGQVLSTLADRVDSLSAAVDTHAEALDGVAAIGDRRISGDMIWFERQPMFYQRLNVVIDSELYAELAAAGHPATLGENRGTHTLSDVGLEDGGRGWLRIYGWGSPQEILWELLVPVARVNAVTSRVPASDDDE